MEKVFDAHIHHTFEISINETIEIFKEEFEQTNTQGGVFLSLPCEAAHEKLECNVMQNILMLFLKHTFGDNHFAFAGLEHSLAITDEKELSDLYLKQVETYVAMGFDGMKMLEGYPSMRKTLNRPLCDKVYDKFYSFMEENNLPITMHLANPANYWDINGVSEWIIKAGRFCDETYPTKAQLHEEVEGIMKKHPKLRLTLAHFGFMSYDVKQAHRWLNDYEYTMFDITPSKYS